MFWENYFGGFCMMDCTLIACGIGYSHENSVEIYDSIHNVNILALDKAYTVSQLMSNWNIQVHNWLKYYVMLRWIDRSKPKHIVQPFPIFMSFAMSLIWHGFWPGYFLTFLGAAVLDILGKNIARTAIAHQIKEIVPRKVLLVILYIFNRFSVSFFCCAFLYQYVTDFNIVYRAFYYAGFWIVLAMMGAVMVLPKRKSA